MTNDTSGREIDDLYMEVLALKEEIRDLKSAIKGREGACWDFARRYWEDRSKNYWVSMTNTYDTHEEFAKGEGGYE